MKSSTQFAKKLSAYSILAGAFIGSAEEASAQIVYTNVTPDDTVLLCCTVTYYLDLNNDGINDFLVWASSSQFNFPHTGRTWVAFVETFGYFGNAAMIDATDGAYVLYENDTISMNRNWSNWADLFNYGYSKTSNTSVYEFFSGGLWKNMQNGFLGLRLINNGDTLYGWLRMDVSLEEVIIKDYAYDTIPNEPILAGATGGFPLAQQNIPSGELSISPNPASSRIVIHYPLAHPTTLTITNTCGIIAKQLTLSATSANTIVPVDDLPAGVYLITVTEEDKRISKKLIISR